MKEFDAQKEVQAIIDFTKDYFVHNGPDCNAIIGLSGGKDSTITAALLVEALGKNRVIAVSMPSGEEDNSVQEIADYLGIECIHINIQNIETEFWNAIEIPSHSEDRKRIKTNLPARIRMAMLYNIAAIYNGRVVNTCNRSEEFVGYSTKYGDLAGDFSLLINYTVREILKIGDALKLPSKWVYKTPDDGMCGKTDEENLGFTYAEVDSYLLDDIYPSYDNFAKIQKAHQRNLHKEQLAKSMPSCSPLYHSFRF